MKHEKRIREYIQGVSVETDAHADDTFLRRLRSEQAACGESVWEISQIYKRKYRVWVAALAAVILVLASVNAVLVSLLIQPEASGWELGKSLAALEQVDSLVMKAYSSAGREYIVHVKGNPFLSEEYRARLESDSQILIFTEGENYLVEKNASAMSADSYDSDSVIIVSNPDKKQHHIPAVEVPVFGRGKMTDMIEIQKIERKPYYIVTGRNRISGDRFSTVFDAESHLPVKSTVWKAGNSHDFIQSEVLEYNSFIPDEIYQLGHVR